MARSPISTSDSPVIFDAARPAPTHAQPLGPHDLEIFAATLMLASIEHAKAYPEAATNLGVSLGHKYGAAVGAPPAGDAFRCDECVEHNRWPRLDPAYER
jgi:hypothetical protein